MALVVVFIWNNWYSFNPAVKSYTQNFNCVLIKAVFSKVRQFVSYFDDVKMKIQPFLHAKKCKQITHCLDKNGYSNACHYAWVPWNNSTS